MTARTAAAAQTRSFITWIWEWTKSIVVALVVWFFLRTFLVEAFRIPSGSMENTLLIGDHLFVNRFIYGPAATDLERELLPLRPIRRGDIVIFRSNSRTDPGLDLVKRAIGVPGDTIHIEHGELYLNGKDVADESYAIHKRPDPPFAPRDWFGPVTVPERRYFFMGDNRDESLDSRFWQVPTLPAHMVKGRALFIYWSNGNQPPEGTNPIAGLLRTALGFFSNTRWDRSFRLIR